MTSNQSIQFLSIRDLKEQTMAELKMIANTVHQQIYNVETDEKTWEKLINYQDDITREINTRIKSA